jgi:hypothetical protein
MQKDYRVCSAHFDKDDFIIPKKSCGPKEPKKCFIEEECNPLSAASGYG